MRPEPDTYRAAQTIGVYHAAHELRLRIPDDLSVIGFNDMPISRWAHEVRIRRPALRAGSARDRPARPPSRRRTRPGIGPARPLDRRVTGPAGRG
ncbi:substrate-binding domain-containing protein [Nonomuraea jabiensis]|uniref:substrate-binding domain-containing protein n=1 Tax=Nonomuraea jabiensis TaxID=882448 RepID=UPI00342661BB